jgi:hypothetical protein
MLTDSLIARNNAHTPGKGFAARRYVFRVFIFPRFLMVLTIRRHDLEVSMIVFAG